LTGVFLCALAVRLLHVWQMRGTPFFDALMGDARGYDAWAQRLAAGDWIGHDVFYQAPLYPYFLGLVYTVFGRDLLIVRIVQAILGASSCVLVGYAANRLFLDRAGVVAGLPDGVLCAGDLLRRVGPENRCSKCSSCRR
jgi:4-amino-4-deoxy-L-arabinose transferase-like glycosyltransferase